MHFIVRIRRAELQPPGKHSLPTPAVAAALLAAAFAAGAQPPVPMREPLVRLREVPRADTPDAIPGEYIVAFENGVAGPGLYGPAPAPAAGAAAAIRSSEAFERRIEARRDGSVVLARYRTAIVGFGARLSDAMLEEIRRIPGIRIEPNRVVPAPREGADREPDALVPPREPLLRPGFPTALRVPVAVAPWGLDRIDRRLLPLDGIFQPKLKGTNVHVYVIDTGVLAAHSEFGGRVRGAEGPGLGHNATMDGKGTGDCRNHGTGVASVIGGKTLGVATDVIIHPVRVFPCSSAASSVAVLIAGVDWVAKDRVNALAKSPVVVNVSFRATKQSSLLDQAIANSILVGRIPYVIAAGNDLDDACKYSPGLVGPAITVGNIKPDSDRRMIDSNFGKCVDLFAPGVKIPMAGNGGINSRTTSSGTSFAAPHVTGVAALYLEKNPNAQPPAIWSAILAAANTKNVGSGTPLWCGIPNPEGSPNVMLHWGSGSDDGITDLPVAAGASAPPKCPPVPAGGR